MRKMASRTGNDVRTGKVLELKRLVESGGYQPDPHRVAEAMVSYARRSMLARPLDGCRNA
jgi:anti-sigma28 factor (negative regulator of flagellin synthesis)